jgi:oligogalacturonide lyase
VLVLEGIKITNNLSSNDQLLYFTTSSITSDDNNLIFISDRTGHPNIFTKRIASNKELQLTYNKEGTLKSYVYFNGNEYAGLGKASISLDSKNKIIYFIQGKNICSVDLHGNNKIIATLPNNQVTAFTHISNDGKRLCVPTTDARALEAEKFIDDSPGYKLSQKDKNEVISNKPDYDIDERVRKENLCSYLRVYDTETGEQLLCEKVQAAWITHVQFSPTDNNIILYNHEWPSDCGIRRMWLWNGDKHIRLRSENETRSRDDWTCHEMWQADGKAIIYHGKYKNGLAYIGKVNADGSDIVEINLPPQYQKYGHFTASNKSNNYLVTDGYYREEGEHNDNWAGSWISVLKIDWECKHIDWMPVCKHYSKWDCQDSHPHPIFNHNDSAILYTSNEYNTRSVCIADISNLLK